MGYEKPKLKNKWWLALEEVDGRLQVATHTGQRGNHSLPGIAFVGKGKRGILSEGLYAPRASEYNLKIRAG